MATKAEGVTCYDKAGAFEELFVLRARDISAPLVVTFWADINELHLGKDHPKIVEARMIAARMKGHPTRRPAD